MVSFSPGGMGGIEVRSSHRGIVVQSQSLSLVGVRPGEQNEVHIGCRVEEVLQLRILIDVHQLETSLTVRDQGVFRIISKRQSIHGCRQHESNC